MKAPIGTGHGSQTNHDGSTAPNHVSTLSKGSHMTHGCIVRRGWMKGIALAAGFVGMVASAPADAATYTWNAAQTGQSWSSNSSWLGGSAPPAGNDLVFGSPGGGSSRTANNNIANNFAVNTLSFSGTTVYTLSGSSITIGNVPGGAITNNTSRSHTINLGVNLVGTTPITVVGGNSSTGLVFGGAVDNGPGINLVSGRASFTQSISGSGPITTSATSALTLSGTSLGGDLAVSGTFTVGTNPLQLNVSGSTTLNATSYTQMQVGSTGQSIVAGGNYDEIITPAVTFGGTLEMNFAGLQYDVNTLETFFTAWDLFTASSYSGNFTSVKVINAPSDYSNMNGNWTLVGGVWQSPIINNDAGNQYFAFDATTGQLVVVPEPSTMVFAGLGMAISGWHWLSKRRKAVASAAAVAG